MNKTELISAVAERTGIERRIVAEVIETKLEVTKETLASGEAVRETGFGSFSVKLQKEREGKNPKTGEPIPITERIKVKFSPGKELKAAVNVKKA